MILRCILINTFSLTPGVTVGRRIMILEHKGSVRAAAALRRLGLSKAESAQCLKATAGTGSKPELPGGLQ